MYYEVSRTENFHKQRCSITSKVNECVLRPNKNNFSSVDFSRNNIAKKRDCLKPTLHADMNVPKAAFT